MAWMGGVASLAALHSCIRAPPPQRNLVTLQRHPSLCCCCSPVPGRAWMRVERSTGPRTSRPVLHARASCVSWVHHPPPHAPLNSTAFPPTFWPSETPLPTYSCGGAACVLALLVPYLIIPPPHYSCCCLFYYYCYCHLLFFILVLVLPLLLACLPACLLACCCWVESIAAPQTESQVEHRTHPHTCRRI